MAINVNTKSSGIITLTTDFGMRDHYVACMKGVIKQISPLATIIDVTHDIERHNILQAAFVLRHTVPWYPPGTIHAVVVDPTVGTARKIIAARYNGQTIVAPDNGLLSFVHHELTLEEVRVVKDPRFALKAVSPTFQGRDVIAPVAAHLANNTNIAQIGPPPDHLEILKLTHDHEITSTGIRGRIVYIDAFGNLITSIEHADCAAILKTNPNAQVLIDNRSVGHIRTTFAEVPVGAPIAIVGSTGHLEIAVNQGSAKALFQPNPDTIIEIR